MKTQRPQDLLFTLFGEYLLHRPGRVWVGSLIELLGPLGMSPASVRQVVSRMSRKGWLDSERRGRRSWYALTAKGRKLLEEGEARIYHPPRDERWDGRWTLITYSIPEERRSVRDALRVRLTWLGCGSLGNGMWITPHDVSSELGDLASELDIESELEVFRAEHVGFTSEDGLVQQAWELGAVAERYREFLAWVEGAYAETQAAVVDGALSLEDAYVRRFELIHEYRRFPLLDPYLPDPLLPGSWPGGRAVAAFESYHDLLVGPADAYVDLVLAPDEEVEKAA